MEYSDRSPLLSGRRTINDEDLLHIAPPKPSMLRRSVALCRTHSDALILVFYMVLFAVTAAGNSIMFKKVLNNLSNYPFFSTQILAFFFVPLFAVPAVVVLLLGHVSKEERKFKFLVAFAIMGVLDGISGWCMIYGGTYTSGALQALLQQGVIPFVMVLSFFVLKTRYHWAQYVGALIIIAGLGVALYPSFIGKCSGSSGGGAGSVVWTIIFFLSTVPMAISTVYKEYQFSGVEVNVWYLQAWDQVFMLVTMVATLPTSFFIPPKDGGVHPADLGVALLNGTKCMFGKNLLRSGCPLAPLAPLIGPLVNSTVGLRNVSAALYPFGNATTHNPCQIGPVLANCDHCEFAYLNVLGYLLFNLIYNISGLLVIKHGNATLFSLANTIRLPLANLSFSIPFIMGAYATPLQWQNGVALLIILVGMVCYRFLPTLFDKLRGKKDKDADKSGDDDDAGDDDGLGTASVVRFAPDPIVREKRQRRPSMFFGVMAADVTPVMPPQASVKKRGNLPHMRKNLYGKLGIKATPPPRLHVGWTA